VTQLQPTDEMLAAYERAWLGTDGGHEVDIRAGLAAVLAIVERGHEVEIARLRARIKQAQESRNHWVRRALDAEERSVAPAPEAGAGHHTQDAREAQCGNCGHLVLPDGSCACSWPIDAARANARPATEPTEEP
jgi:hypothetical protein